MNKKIFFSILVFVMLTTNILAMDFQKNKPIVFIFNENYGLLNNNLDVVIAPEYEKCFITADKEYAVLGKNNDLNYNYFVIDYSGNILFSKETKFYGLKNISGDQLYFESINKNESDVIYISSKNKQITINEKLYNIYSVTNTSESQDFISVGKYYFDIETQEKIFEDKEFLHVMPMIDGVAVVVDKNFKKKIIKRNGEIIYDDVINSTKNFTEGLLAVKGKYKSGFIDKTGNIVIECSIYPDGKDSPKGIPNLNCSFSEGLAYVPTDEYSWTLFDRKGNIIKENLKYYPSANIYSEGFLQVYDKETGKCGYLNKKGEVIIPFVFDDATSFQNGYARVIYKHKDALIDLEGNLYLTSDIMQGNKLCICNLINK